MNIPPASILQKKISLVTILAILLILDFFFQHIIRHLPISDAIESAILNAVIYTGILYLTTRFDLARVTLCFLALPYLIFIPGWLNLPTAIPLLIIYIYCMRSSLCSITVTSHQVITWNDFFAFLLILTWVNISGAGGYGFQWEDYGVNNARLHDLIVNEWPIRYGANQNFVYYFGYFLPAAIIGKISSIEIAIHSMYGWTALGVTLAVRWLSYLSKWKFSIALVFIFILFGPVDLLNVLYISAQNDFSWSNIQLFWSGNLDGLNFTTSNSLGVFIGNYLSNVFQLYWSPQQVISGWLCTAFMTHLFLQKKFNHVLFIYALLCLWAPLAMIALLPFVLLIIVSQLCNKNGREILSIENTLGAGSLIIVFVVFYLSGSATANPSHWLFEVIDWRSQWDVLLVFYLAAWGLYALAMIPFILKSDARSRLWFACLVFALTILPLRIFGEWSDLLCRGSAPLMFLLLVFILQAIRHYNTHRNKIAVILFGGLFLLGTTSAVMINRISLQRYGLTQAVNPLLSYSNAYPNLGPDDSPFEHWFRRTLPTQNPAK